MNLHTKIYVAGHNGLVGSALVRQFQAEGYTNLITRSFDELDLRDQQSVADFFASEKPEVVLLAAAKVGGIHANNTYPAEFIHDNLVIQTNIIHSAWKNGCDRLLFLGSSCIYPKMTPQPMEESCLLTGPLEPTNSPYAIAKIAGIEMCHAYNRQYHTRYLAVMPTNLYGPGDNFHPENSHVLPALLRRFHEARENNSPEVIVWGSGTPMREFLYVDDMAKACTYLIGLTDTDYDDILKSYAPPLINIGTGTDVSIRELAETIKDVVCYEGTLSFDSTKPDGTPRKLQDVTRINSLGWTASVDLRKGIELTYRWFLNNQKSIRV